jgi:acetyl-CoA carboxylase biotin carboxyl carrier protein
MAEEIPAHITGTIWKIEVKVGEEVEEEDTLVILESMKMEMPIEAPFDGIIKEIRTTEGASVEEGQVLIVMEES